MVEKIESFQSFDGVLHQTEETAVIHEALLHLEDMVPGLRDRWNIILRDINVIADALAPLVAYRAKNHPDAIRENHPEATVRVPDLPCNPRQSDRVITPTPIEPVPFNPPVADEDVGCDCGALLAGNAGSDHLKTCAQEVEKRRRSIEATEQRLGIRSAAPSPIEPGNF